MKEPAAFIQRQNNDGRAGSTGAWRGIERAERSRLSSGEVDVLPMPARAPAPSPVPLPLRRFMMGERRERGEGEGLMGR